MSPPDPRGFRCKLCGVVIAEEFRLIGEPRRPCPIMMIQHVGERHYAEFRRRTDHVPTTDGLKFVLRPLFEPVEDGDRP